MYSDTATVSFHIKLGGECMAVHSCSGRVKAMSISEWRDFFGMQTNSLHTISQLLRNN